MLLTMNILSRPWLYPSLFQTSGKLTTCKSWDIKYRTFHLQKLSVSLSPFKLVTTDPIFHVSRAAVCNSWQRPLKTREIVDLTMEEIYKMFKRMQPCRSHGMLSRNSAPHSLKPFEFFLP